MGSIVGGIAWFNKLFFTCNKLVDEYWLSEPINQYVAYEPVFVRFEQLNTNLVYFTIYGYDAEFCLLPTTLPPTITSEDGAKSVGAGTGIF